jgi:hypothetical protein
MPRCGALLASGVAEIREADLPGDREAVARLWLDYLMWGNDGLESRYGFRLPVQEAIEHDLGSIAKFQPPDGRLLLAFEDDVAVGRPRCSGLARRRPRSSACGSTLLADALERAVPCPTSW